MVRTVTNFPATIFVIHRTPSILARRRHIATFHRLEAGRISRRGLIRRFRLDKSRSQRILWLLEELKVDYELKIFKRGKDFHAPPELKDVHPLGKSPVVGIQAADAAKPLIIAESGAIVEYLTEYFGKWMIPKRYPDGKEGLIGAETEEWLRYRFLMHYAEGSFMTIMLIALMTHSEWRTKHGASLVLTFPKTFEMLPCLFS